MNNDELIQKAKEITKLNKLSDEAVAGEVGSALITDKGNVYLGVSIHACCGVGSCAEYIAIANMVLKREYKIKRIVSVSIDGIILSPCGSCRELMYQIDDKNYNTKIILEKNRLVKLSDLLPEIWQKKFY